LATVDTTTRDALVSVKNINNSFVPKNKKQLAPDVIQQLHASLRTILMDEEATTELANECFNFKKLTKQALIEGTVVEGMEAIPTSNRLTLLKILEKKDKFPDIRRLALKQLCMLDASQVQGIVQTAIVQVMQKEGKQKNEGIHALVEHLGPISDVCLKILVDLLHNHDLKRDEINIYKKVISGVLKDLAEQQVPPDKVDQNALFNLLCFYEQNGVSDSDREINREILCRAVRLSDKENQEIRMAWSELQPKLTVPGEPWDTTRNIIGSFLDVEHAVGLLPHPIPSVDRKGESEREAGRNDQAARSTAEVAPQQVSRKTKARSATLTQLNRVGSSKWTKTNDLNLVKLFPPSE
jgi:hypothetical protein